MPKIILKGCGAKLLPENSDMPLRSWLFVPANHARRVEKALASAAHAVIVDLEDAVPLLDKAEARALAGALLDQAERANLFLRMNALDTSFALEDVAAIVSPALRGIMLPKSESARDIAVLDWLIGQHEDRLSLRRGQIEIMPLIESALGLSNVASICSASARVRRLAFGAADFTHDLGMTWSADEHELWPYQAALLAASRAAGLEAPIDTPWIDVTDQAGMLASTTRASTHGFQGKMCIHPDQIELVHHVYAPTRSAIEHAKRVVSAFQDSGSAVVMLDGKMVDYPVVLAARRILHDADRLGTQAAHEFSH